MGKVFAATILAFAVLGSPMAGSQQAAAPESAGRTSSELHAHNYGDHDRACMAWTDWCRDCRRDTDGGPSCNNIGMTCGTGVSSGSQSGLSVALWLQQMEAQYTRRSWHP